MFGQLSALLEHPYAKPALLVLLVLVVFYLFRSRSAQYGGAPTEPEQEVASKEPVPPAASPKQSAPPVAVVLFYSNHCGHCQVLMPTWDQIMNKYRDNSQVMLDKVDCAEDREAGEQFQIKGYPTILKLRKDGTREEYQGDRSPQSLESFISAS